MRSELHTAIRHRGFTLLEVLIVIGIIAVLAAIAVPGYMEQRYKSQVTAAVAELKSMEKSILGYSTENGRFPDHLAEAGLTNHADPWGRPYRYLRINGGTTPGLNGALRKDKQANPVNSDFDLYSVGRDGETAAQFSSQFALDDIVRANDGAFFGLASNH
jgi:general secretion pathway protein G